MPNWCENTLEVSGTTEDIKAFKTQAKKEEGEHKTDLSLAQFVPLPAELKDTRSPALKPNKKLIAQLGFDNWYDWQIHNWGTKWDVNATLSSEKPRTLHYFFDTAWSPPTAWLEKVSAMFPNLKFKLKYEEPGMAFHGTLKAYQGTLDDQCFQD